MESRFFSRLLYDGETMENPKDPKDVREFPTGDMTTNGISTWIRLFLAQQGKSLRTLNRSERAPSGEHYYLCSSRNCTWCLKLVRQEDHSWLVL